MKFKEGTSVYTAEGEKVGSIERFVLDPRGHEISGLVVRKDFLFTQDKVIPPDAVATADEDRVTLHENVGDPDEFPPYEEVHYIEPGDAERRAGSMDPYVGPVYYYPPIGSTTWARGTYLTQHPVSQKQNIPDGKVALKEGSDVISRDGKDVGNVKEIYTDAETERITHFLVERGVFFTEEKLIPESWVAHVSDDKIELAVDASSLERLRQIN
ncbi:MAG: PRC-barrel domain-containing protein [Aggregatilineales bacterium]